MTFGCQAALDVGDYALAFKFSNLVSSAECYSLGSVPSELLLVSALLGVNMRVG